ncbi:sulfite exporter TauE/SafE family protein [Corynebacterium choanae]|uniref:Probable membrane transporter protein n=1 Tax=Corynebacterium choanae TaxID=1862358 RepID=A0A3G6JDS7_9CORY|nr:sulfite exporter TauE/SafE family protein [Corynebacterium choanae]AZA14294.1 Sulfite exporter TauE/SafE [Corynebacterium choanae]
MTVALQASLVGVIVGLVIGALGAGGGIIAVPVLTYLLGQSPHDATSGSLVIVGLTALATLPAKYRLGQVRLRQGILFGALSAAGAIIGRIANHHLDGHLLFVSFSVLLLVVSVLMMRNARTQRRTEQSAASPTRQLAAQDTDRPGTDSAVGSSPSPISLIATATLTGMLTGLFGVGGGFIVVPILMLVLRFTVREAAGTSLVVMVIASAVSILTGLAAGQFHVDWPVVLCFLLGSTVAARLGGRLSQQVRQSTLSFLFALLVFLIGALTLTQTLLAAG